MDSPSIKIGQSRATKSSVEIDSTKEQEANAIGKSTEHRKGSRLIKPEIKIEESAADFTTEMDATNGNINIVEENPISKQKRVKKANKYGVTLGQSPYEDLEHPTQAECQKVNDLLSKVHGVIRAPKSIPLPSLTVAGCGEVPCILEALLRTLLSAHTSFSNAALAIQGAIQRYGILKSGPGQGCLDWNAARLSSREDVEHAIKRGGMGPSKSKSIKSILDMVYEENQHIRRRIADSKGKVCRKTDHDVGEPPESTDDQKAAIISPETEGILEKSEDVLTLDYMHALPANEAFAKFLTFPGIGVKTAACTLLFCMQRPLFAVDTHVYRLCKWLGWVPANATRDSTFAHCDVKVPDHLKYSLHQLLIRHGQQCVKCQANTGPSTEGWSECECAIEELVARTGNRKNGIPIVRKKATHDISEEDSNEESAPKQGSKRRKGAQGEGVEEMAPKPRSRKRAKSPLSDQDEPNDSEAGAELASQSAQSRSKQKTSVIETEDAAEEQEADFKKPPKVNSSKVESSKIESSSEANRSAPKQAKATATRRSKVFQGESEAESGTAPASTSKSKSKSQDTRSSTRSSISSTLTTSKSKRPAISIAPRAARVKVSEVKAKANAKAKAEAESKAKSKDKGNDGEQFIDAGSDSDLTVLGDDIEEI